MIQILLLLCLCLSSCEKYYLSVMQQKMSREYLASTPIGSPDPLQEDPPVGQMLVIDWFVPISIIEEKAHIQLYVLYRDHTEKMFCYPMEHRLGYVTYCLLGKEFEEKKGLLTYRAEIVTENGVVYREWKHQLWVQLIDLKEP